MGAAMRHQPQGRARLNQSSALANGLLCAVVPSSRFDAVLSVPYTQDGQYATAASPIGLGLSTNGSSSAIWIPIKSIALTKFTLFGVFRSNGNGVDTRALALGSSSNTVPIVQIGSGATAASKVRLYARNNSNTTPSDLNSTESAFDGTLHTVSIVYDGTQLTCYIDGKLDSTNAMGASTFTVDRFCVGALRRSTAGQWWAGSTFFAAAWQRDLSDSEIDNLSQNPWQLFTSSEEEYEVLADQSHTLLGSNCTQDNLSSAGSITQRHTLASQPSVQANESSSSDIVQHHILAGSSSTQINQCSTAAIVERHVLATTASSQANESSTGVISTRHVLQGAPCVQANVDSVVNNVVQRHLLAGSNSTQNNECSTAGLGEQPHILSGSSCSQTNISSSGAISQRHLLQGSDSISDQIVSVGQIAQRHRLIGSNCIQNNLSPSISLSTGANELLTPNYLYTVQSEDLIYTVVAENRIFTVQSENRILEL